ncbi:MAG: helix-turn-helix domain-containing protein [Oscillospiraceae bacterium]
MTLKEARKKANLSQTKAALLIGVPLRTWQNWEGGKRIPPDYVERLIIAELLRHKPSGED